MSYPNTPQDTPFDQQMQDDVQSRRTLPTASTIRIGDSAQEPTIPTASIASHVPSHATGASGLETPTIKPRERTPLPIIIGVAMALGAVCVMGGALIIRRIVPDTRPAFPTTTQNQTAGEVVMNPDLVIENPHTEEVKQASPQETPAVEVAEIPSTQPENKILKSESTPTTPPDTAQEKETNDDNSKSVPLSSNAPFDAPGYELTPPPGFSLSQKGRRTIWNHKNGAQILVETGKAGAGSLRDGWLRLERDLKKRYGDRYKSLGITESQLAGQPAAVWEFELTGKDGITRRKIDIGIQYEGRGYAVLGSAPKENFDKVFPEIRAALDSFKLKEKVATEEPQPAKRSRKTTRQIPNIKEKPSTEESEFPSEETEKPREQNPATQRPAERGY
ncbi:MAG TPA: hypothetical protein VGB77_07585 [Abditibacteriaceae bacterium]|jgi:hypothetical protein